MKKKNIKYNKKQENFLRTGTAVLDVLGPQTRSTGTANAVLRDRGPCGPRPSPAQGYLSPRKKKYCP